MSIKNNIQQILSQTWQTISRYPVSTAEWETSNKIKYTAGCGGLSMYSCGAINKITIIITYINFLNKIKYTAGCGGLNMYFCGAVNKMNE